MRSALSRTLLVCLVGSALPVTAQEKTELAAAPAAQQESAPLATQDDPRIAHSFDELRARLKHNQFIFVTDQHGQRIRGRFKEMTAGRLVVVVPKLFSRDLPLAFTEQDVAAVKARPGWGRKGLLIGVIAGAAVGIIPGALMESDIATRGETLGFLVGFSGAIGAAIGGITGAVLDRPRVVFEHAARVSH
jgi:hypothetical protein